MDETCKKCRCVLVARIALTRVIVRREQLADLPAVRAVQAAAFDRGEGEPVEVRLLDQLRESDDWVPELSWLAEIDGRIVGHVVCTRGHVGEVGCVGLGPLGVVPDCQRAGVGTALMHAVIGAADALGEPLIALLGDPAYYSRFGFTPSTAHGVHPPDASWGEHFQIRQLSTWTEPITGTFRYSASFNTIT